MSEIADCPFCGGNDSADNACMDAKVHLGQFRSAIGKEAWRVECRCGAMGRGFVGVREGPAQAIEWWNRRAPIQPLKGE